MKALLALAAIAAAAPLATASAQSLPGVSDKETRIHSNLVEFHRGHGDVLFVRDRENKWYRVQTNKGCLAGHPIGESLIVRHRDVGGNINLKSQFYFAERGILCDLVSIRASKAPPQVNSKSPVTLD